MAPADERIRGRQQQQQEQERASREQELQELASEFNTLHERANAEHWYSKKNNPESIARTHILATVYYLLFVYRPSESSKHSTHINDIKTYIGSKEIKLSDCLPVSSTDKGSTNKERIARLKVLCHFLANFKIRQCFGNFSTIQAIYPEEPCIQALKKDESLPGDTHTLLDILSTRSLTPRGSSFVGVRIPLFGQCDFTKKPSFERSIRNILRTAHDTMLTLEANITPSQSPQRPSLAL
jgi:hypothetical protein